MAAPTDLNDLAAALLQSAADSIDEASPVVSAPDRQIVWYGTPVDDCCEQLAVHINPVTRQTTRSPSQQRHRYGGWLNAVTFTVTVGRCVPGVEVEKGKPKLPTPAEVNAASRLVQTEGWALWNGLNNRLADGVLFAELTGRCQGVDLGPMLARTPSGKCAGWTLDVRAVVFGYAVAGS